MTFVTFVSFVSFVTFVYFVTFVFFVVAQTGAYAQRPDWRTTTGWVPPGFVGVPPRIRVSPNFRATAQAAPCDSCDGDPQETRQDRKKKAPQRWKRAGHASC
ncbi:MAG: hypothetical protein RLY70_3601 [Planctomycetota bacterium]